MPSKVAQSLRSQSGIVHDEAMAGVNVTAPQRIGRYELCSKIASGGMASVYFGRIVGSEGFSRVVAIKRMHPHLADAEGFRAMFIDEARLAARINHPNVAQIIDLVAQGEDLLLVMNYIHGVSVSRLMEGDGGRLSAPVAVRIALDALYGLHAAHTAKDAMGTPLGIVHRDVSPQNLLVSVDGVTLVVDFGVAKAASRLQTSHEGQLKGKARYMPPEQVRHHPVSPATDVYSLSVVLWEMLTREHLFTGATVPAVLAQVLDGVVVAPRTIVPDLPPALEEVVMRGLERDLTRRYPSALAMAEALEGLKLAASPADVASVVAERAHTTLAARDTAMRRIHDAPSDDQAPSESVDVVVPEGTLTRRPAAPKAPASQAVEVDTEISIDDPGERAPARRSRTAVVAGALIGVATCAMIALALTRREAAAPPQALAIPSASAVASSELAARTPVPGPSAEPPATVVSAAAPSAVTVTSTSPPKPPRPRRTPTSDCAQNPRVLGPDGVYQVRRECLGR
jgi:serine/threonine-protein kinase